MAHVRWSSQDRDGRAYAILPVHPESLMVQHDGPDYAAA